MRKLLLIAVALWLPGCGGPNEEAPWSSVHASSTCVPQVESSYLDESTTAGDVTVTTEDGDVVVTVAASGTLVIGRIDAYAGPGPIPADDAGAADPSLFPYHLVVDPAARSAELRIPLADLALSCGDQVTVAVRSVVGYSDSGTGSLLEVGSAWAGGATGFAYAPCCEPAPAGPACTRGLGSWKKDPDGWPVSQLDLGSTTYDTGDLLEILRAPPKGDATILLARQLITAKLNVAAGGPAPDGVQDAIDAADAWLDAHAVVSFPAGFHAGRGAGREAKRLADGLAAFNEGQAGVPACQVTAARPD